MDPLAATSRWIAAARARESARPDALFADPLAAELAGPEGFALLDRMKPYLLTDDPVYYAIRTRFFDDFLLRVVRHFGIRQVVLVAAGMDTRAFRLDWPAHTCVYELDRPGLLATKQAALDRNGAKPSCTRVTLGADLTQPWATALQEAGYDRSTSSVWLLEGILYYLTEPSVRALLSELSSIAVPGSRLAAEFVGQETFRLPAFRPLLDALSRSGTPWLFGTDRPEDLLGPLGWEARVTQPGEPDANFGRWPYPPVPREVPGYPRSYLLTARREERTPVHSGTRTGTASGRR